MTASEIYREIRRKGSCLCVGLDVDPARMPRHLAGEPDGLYRFNREIIDATHDLAVAYKPNLAFYEAHGSDGLVQLERTVDYIRSMDPNLFIIADAKRGDIGNTAEQYARSLFLHYDFDAITLSPYMGRDSVEPFLQFEGKWAILLGLTSNPGASDLQMKNLASGETVYQYVIRESASWGNPDNLMYVVGATRPDHLRMIRSLVPDHFLLVPGVGAQGGSLEMVMEHGANNQVGLLINSSRAIIHATRDEKFQEMARERAAEMRHAMQPYITP